MGLFEQKAGFSNGPAFLMSISYRLSFYHLLQISAMKMQISEVENICDIVFQ